MQWRHLLFAILAFVAVCQGYQHWRLRPLHPADGEIAPDDPVQTEVSGLAQTTIGRWKLVPRAHYDITARILSREDYHFDPISDLIPEDLALGWGPMSDNSILRGFDISQGARFYTWRPIGTLPIARETVIEHSANTHVIPATALVRRELGALRVGQVVRLQGYLVDGNRDDGAYIRTSMTRADTGAGACEVVLVDEVDVQ